MINFTKQKCSALYLAISKRDRGERERVGGWKKRRHCRSTFTRNPGETEQDRENRKREEKDRNDQMKDEEEARDRQTNTYFFITFFLFFLKQ